MATLKKSFIFFAGYLIMLFVLLLVSKSDKYSPSIFGKWMTILTPVYIIAYIGILFLIKKRKNEKPD